MGLVMKDRVVDLIRGEDMNRDIEGTLGDKRLMDLYRTIATAKYAAAASAARSHLLFSAEL